MCEDHDNTFPSVCGFGRRRLTLRISPAFFYDAQFAFYEKDHEWTVVWKVIFQLYRVLGASAEALSLTQEEYEALLSGRGTKHDLPRRFMSDFRPDHTA